MEAPRLYWQGRRTAHGVYAWAWGLIALGSSIVLMKLLAGGSLSQLKSISDKLKQAPDDQGHVASWTIALPEIAVVAVAGFLILWAMRFVVRQLAQHIARAEEAAQRVTMVKTFLALADYHEDGQPSLITEADRALMIQALFRPGTLQSPEDGPPSHWVEDVLRRLSATRNGDHG